MFQWTRSLKCYHRWVSDHAEQNKPEPCEKSEWFSKVDSSSPDSGNVKEEIVNYDDAVEPAPTESRILIVKVEQ